MQFGPIYAVATPLSEIVVPLEYGMTATERLDIAVKIGRQLIQKFIADIENAIETGKTPIAFKGEVCCR